MAIYIYIYIYNYSLIIFLHQNSHHHQSQVIKFVQQLSSRLPSSSMADHFEYMLDWDLDAVIRGCCSDHNNNNGGGGGYGYPSSYCETIQKADNLLLNSDFPDYSSVNLDDLEEIYKPFYSLLHQYPPASAAAASPLPATTFPAPCVVSAARDVKEESSQKLEKQVSLSESDLTTSSTSAPTAASPRPKRKSQQKRVVQHVTADGLSADKWAWRKYGQKPIKGSPYPRSYYRCSSSKGCPARKQVEQNSLDPNMFIIAYRAEHNHAQPTRRSSLSGITRNKLSLNKQQPATARTSSTTSTSTPQSSSSSPVSPSTNLSPMMSGGTDDEFNGHRSCRAVEDEEITKVSEENEFMFNEGDDFFKGLEEFDGMTFDGSFLDHQVMTGFPHWSDERSSASAASYNNMA